MFILLSQRERERERKKGRACFKHARNTHTRILVITQPRSQMQVGTDGPKRVESRETYPTSTTQKKDLITYSFVINLLPIDIFSFSFSLLLFLFVFFICSWATIYFSFLFFFVISTSSPRSSTRGKRGESLN